MALQLWFKKPLLDAIRAGKKRTTIRRWNRAFLKAGDQSYAPGFGFLSIEAVDRVELEQLTDADAKADGFADATALRDALFALFPDYAIDGKQWFRVAFTPHQPPQEAESEIQLPLF